MTKLTNKQIQLMKEVSSFVQVEDVLDVRNLSDAELKKAKKTIISQLKDEAKYYERIITNLRASRNRFVYAIEDQLAKNRTKFCEKLKRTATRVQKEKNDINI